MLDIVKEDYLGCHIWSFRPRKLGLVGPLCTRLRGPQVVGGLFDLVGLAGGEGGVAAVAPPFGVEEEVVDGPKESARVALIGWKLRGYRVTRLHEIVLHAV